MPLTLDISAFEGTFSSNLLQSNSFILATSNLRIASICSFVLSILNCFDVVILVDIFFVSGIKSGTFEFKCVINSSALYLISLYWYIVQRY